MGDEIITLQCPQCGATEIARDTLTTGICRYCGSTVYIKNTSSEQEEVGAMSDPVTTKIREGKASDSCGETDVCDKARTYTTVWDEVEFLRSSLLVIASDESTPEDILNFDFSPVTVEVEHYYEMEFGNNVVYNCSIGYYRTEQYTSYESQTYYRNGKPYTKSVPVQRTRTVTVWQPFSGNYFDDNWVVVNNEDPNADCQRFISYAKANANNLITFQSSPYRDTPLQILTDSTMQVAVNKSQNIAITACESKLPGDVHRDFSSTCKTEVYNMDYYVAPLYNVEFTYEGKKCGANSYVGEKNIVTDVPHNRSKVEKEIDVATKKQALATIISMVVFAIVAGVLMVLSNIFSDFGNQIFMFVLPALFVPCLVLYILYVAKRKQLTKNIISRSLKIKCARLKQVFDKMNIAPLTDEELQLFERAKGGK